MPTRDTVRIAAVSDMHYGKQSQGMLQSLFSQIADRADVLVMPGDLTDYGLAGGGARARARPHGMRQDPDRGRAREPRLRVGPVRGGRAHPHRCRRPRARWGLGRDPGGGVRRREGVRRRIRSRRARPVGRGGDQGVRAGGGERSAQAGVGARQAEDDAPHRDRALRADRRHGRGRARRDLSRGSARAGSKSRSCDTR